MLLGLFRLFFPPPPLLSIEFSWRQSGVNELRRAPSALSNGSSGRRCPFYRFPDFRPQQHTFAHLFVRPYKLVSYVTVLRITPHTSHFMRSRLVQENDICMYVSMGLTFMVGQIKSFWLPELSPIGSDKLLTKCKRKNPLMKQEIEQLYSGNPV